MCVPRTTDLALGLRMCYIVKGCEGGESWEESREGRVSGYGNIWVRGCDSESEKTCVGGRLRSEAVRSIA